MGHCWGLIFTFHSSCASF